MGVQAELINHFKAKFPQINHSELIETIINQGSLVDLAAGEQILGIDDVIRVIPLVLEGAIKVFRSDDSGNSMLIYHINPGESCAITLSACLKRGKSTIKAVAQLDSKLIALPAHLVYDLMIKFPAWNQFVVQAYANRFEEILSVLDDVAFRRLDVRLLQYLKNQSHIQNTPNLNITKTQMANDLNSSREVISRLLKKMEDRQLIKLTKNNVEIIEITALP